MEKGTEKIVRVSVRNLVEFILRGAKKRRAMAVQNAVTINAESGIQVKLQAVK